VTQTRLNDSELHGHRRIMSLPTALSLLHLFGVRDRCALHPVASETAERRAL
jgi:hypothetical protein